MTTAAPAQSLRATDPSPSRRSLRGLDAVNFFLAALMASFGPYVAAYLAERKWTEQDIGFVLTASGVAGLLSLLPGGEVLDLVRSKRTLVALGAAIASAGALSLAFSANFPLVFAALALQGSTGGLLGPAIAALSLGLVGHVALAERLGRNQRFASTGSLIAAGIMGLLGHFLSFRAVFFGAALLALPLFGALVLIRPSEVHFARSSGAPQQNSSEILSRASRRSLWRSRGLVVFGACLFLFQLANASVLPLLGEDLAHREPHNATLLLSALIVVPQIVVAVLAPWVGRRAQSWGRRPLLLIGFGALPIRALMFTFTADPFLLMGFQLLDGISGTVLGVLTALVIADVTRGSGRFNLAQGAVGTASGVGASLSTTMTGLLVTRFGRDAGFLSIAVVALLATGIVALLMPETRAARPPRAPTAGE